MKFKIASVDSLIIYFNEIISLETSIEVKEAYEKIKNINHLIEVIPSYHSIFITYDILEYDYDSLCQVIKLQLGKKSTKINTQKRVFEIPVYYGEEVALDLERIATFSKLSKEDVILKHTEKIYNVYAIGFAPGFAYLGSVTKEIALGRLSTPRKRVPKGAVAIANEQTAIYPNESPGGWNIIGRTPFPLYDKKLPNLTLFSIGDGVKFHSISKEEYLSLGGTL